MFGPVVILATRKYVYLLLYLLMFVPLVNIVAGLGISILMGIKAQSFVDSSSTFASPEERLGFMKGIDHAGKMMFIIGLIALGVVLAIAIFFNTFFLSFMPFMGKSGF